MENCLELTIKQATFQEGFSAGCPLLRPAFSDQFLALLTTNNQIYVELELFPQLVMLVANRIVFQDAIGFIAELLIENRGLKAMGI
jgi:hypothetical protein